MSKIKAIDLFSGCGGVSCGLTNAGFKMTGAVEINKDAVEIYKKYKSLSKVNVILDDICNVRGADLLKNSNINIDELYLLAGCPPCQNFSSQNRNGRKKSKGEKEKLLHQYLRIIKEIYPPFVLMENVSGLKNKENLPILNEFLESLRNESEIDDRKKYFVIYNILNAADYGVPQKRKRFVLHAIRKDMYNLLVANGYNISLPTPSHNQKGENGLLPWNTVWEAIGDLPPIKAGETYVGEGIFNHKCASLSDINLERISIIRKNGGSRIGLPSNLVLNCHKKYNGHKDVYGIMDPNKPAPTMTGGCLCYSKGRFGHPYQNRAISIREAARIQTFPDDFIFSDSITKSSLEIGNAVPVKLVEASGKSIMKEIKFCKKLLKI